MSNTEKLLKEQTLYIGTPPPSPPYPYPPLDALLEGKNSNIDKWRKDMEKRRVMYKKQFSKWMKLREMEIKECTSIMKEINNA